MPAPILQTLVGISGPEASFGTAAPAVAWIPVSTAPKPDDKEKMDVDKAWRGSMGSEYGVIAGVYDTTYALDSYVFPDTIGYPLAGTLGDVAYTGGTNAGASTTTATAMTAGTTTTFTVVSGTGIAPGTVLAIDTAANLELGTCAAGTTGTTVILTKPVQLSHTGTVTIQPVTAPFTSAFSLYNAGNGQPPTYTITDWYAVNGRQYPGSTFTDVNLKLTGDGLLSYTATADALPSVSLAGAKPVSSFTQIRPLSGWQGAVQIGGTPNLTVLTADVSIKRKASPIHPIAGQQAATAIFAADVSVSGKLQLIMNDDSQLLNYLNNSQPALDINYSVGSGATATQFKVHISQAAYTAAPIERSKEYVTLGVTFSGVFNTTDVGLSGGFSPVKVTLQNAVAPRSYK